jgi:hypothetical protein
VVAASPTTGIPRTAVREKALDPRGAAAVRTALPDRRADAPALVEKIRRAATFNQGFETMTYLSSALVEMKMHLARSE